MLLLHLSQKDSGNFNSKCFSCPIFFLHSQHIIFGIITTSIKEKTKVYLRLFSNNSLHKSLSFIPALFAGVVLSSWWFLTKL